MPVAEIAAGITSLRATLDIAKSMIGLRDAEAFRAKSIELQETILRALDSGIEAREAYAQQLDAIRALETEVARLKAWDTEKEKYELKPNYMGAVTYMLKPEARGSEPPHWLCPNCYAHGKKSFLLPIGRGTSALHRIHKCSDCKTEALMYGKPKWDDPIQQSSE
jgi:hypothetical protein